MNSLFGLDQSPLADERLALLTTVYDPAQRMIVESILNDAEIPFLVKERGSGSAVKVITGFSIFGSDVFVLKEHLKTASILITPPQEEETQEEEEEA